MTPGAFYSQLDLIRDITKSLDLLLDYQRSYKLPQNPAALFREKDYYERWRLSLKEKYYTLQFNDFSLWSFSPPPDASFSFYDCPIDAWTFSDFMLEEFADVPHEDWEIYRKNYENALDSAVRKETVTPIRYDYHPHQYQSGRHPASHVHLGHESQIRIGTDKIMQPLSFLCFVLRQRYPQHWGNLCQGAHEPNVKDCIRTALASVGPQYFCAMDSYELILK
jgi:hypothetical protein